MTVTLHNRSRQQRTFHLEHDAACGKGGCRCIRRVVGVQEHDPAKGVRTLKARVHRVPSAITLNAMRTEGSSLKGLPDGILNVPDVAKAIREKTIAWEKDADDAPPHHAHSKLAAQKRAADAANEADKAAAATKAEG